jgi:tetratricopeptide (TPR) repeat protein
MSNDKLRGQAEDAVKAGDRVSAIRLYSLIIKHEPDDVDVRVKRAMLWSQVGESHLALADLDKALELKPRSPALYLRRAGVWLDAQKYVRCERELTSLLNLVPEYLEARNWRAEVRLAYGDVYGALVDLGEVLRKDPFNEEALRWYAFAKGQIAAQQITKLSKEEKMSGSWWKGITPPDAEVPKVKTSMAAAGPLRVDVDVARWPSGARLEISIVQPPAAPKNKASRKAADNEPAAVEGDKPPKDA